MTKKITKKQHKVPVFYLKRFEDNTGFLYCFDKKTGKTFPARPKDICFSDYLYEVKTTEPWSNNNKFLLPNNIEDMFVPLEREYNHVVQNIISKSVT